MPKYPTLEVSFISIIIAAALGRKAYWNTKDKPLTCRERKLLNPYKWLVWVNGIPHINPIADSWNRSYRKEGEFDSWWDWQKLEPVATWRRKYNYLSQDDYEAECW